MTQYETAKAFFEACETGKGWEGCTTFCHDGATFSCQADALAETTTLAGYAEWMKGLLTPVPDGRYKLTAFAVDEARGTVVACAEFHGTQTGEGGPVAPTGKTVVSDYAYVIQFNGDKISHMTKIWNDVHALRGLGWA
ncbi:ester cyclase [Roseobacter litoralis]|uniref:Polyketide cyclase-like protein n=1 Tax=Roseobacter litoralis (strain ATCC 49566 / DSM 6996 / JCM 21268 / NBRC 15278 / OCh 149) TaxID=391595 RepID=F7ZG41_ROSLO|nr:nuclear transport factor 2 family protein [Roseobacter litoralis]AEI94772.1 polyketide cyclase-like protein [Roseobacter litoralis Och 149]